MHSRASTLAYDDPQSEDVLEDDEVEQQNDDHLQDIFMEGTENADAPTDDSLSDGGSAQSNASLSPLSSPQQHVNVVQDLLDDVYASAPGASVHLACSWVPC